MDFWIFAGICLVIFFLILKFLNVRRDVFFKKMASEYNLQFEKPPYPLFMKGGNVFYPFRRLSGEIRGKKVLIEDGVFSLLPSLGLITNLLPRSLFGDTYSRTRSNFLVNDQEVKDVYMKESKIVAPNFVAPKNSIELFLKNL